MRNQSCCVFLIRKFVTKNTVCKYSLIHTLFFSLSSSLNFCVCSPYNLHSSCCSLFSQTQRSPHVFYRHDLINQLQHNHALVTLVAENLSAYMETMRQFSKGTLSQPEIEPCVSLTFNFHRYSSWLSDVHCL